MTIFDRPSSSELLKAVIDFIDAETKSDDYPANKRFKLQIVSNVLNIVKREIDKSGCFFDIPDKSEMFSLYCPSFFNKYRQENAPIFIITYIEI